MLAVSFVILVFLLFFNHVKNSPVKAIEYDPAKIHPASLQKV